MEGRPNNGKTGSGATRHPAPLAIVFAHITDTKNIGDIASGPYHYFEFPNSKVVDLRYGVPVCDVAIFGGGALGKRFERGISSLAKTKIAWGVGYTDHKRKDIPPAPEGFKLYGSRDYGQKGAIYAPCPSCMAPEFNCYRDPELGVVAYLNGDPNIRARYPKKIEGIPVKFNTCSFKDAIEFLASGETVVTDSWHGCYWATLLGRRVVCLPYSSKFHSFKFPPTMADKGDWNRAIHKARNYPQALADSRNATLAFYERVCEVIYGSARAL